MRFVLPMILLACARPAPPEAAIRELESFSAPADARSWYLQALYAEAAGDTVRADRAMDWALRLDRPSPWVWLASARLAELRGDHARAREHACAALERAPELAEAEALLARLPDAVACAP